jgi:hypothetical protein
MIRQTAAKLLGVATAIVALAVVSVVTALLFLRSDGDSRSSIPELVSAGSVLPIQSRDKMAEAGIEVIDEPPNADPRVSLAAAAAYLEQEAGVGSLRGALIVVTTYPESGNPIVVAQPGSKSLAWAIVVDTSTSTVPELFVPDKYSVAFIDADGGGLLGVLTQ